MLKPGLFHGARGDRPLTALALLLTGVFALACQDSTVKLMSSETSFWQFQTLRSMGNLTLLVILALAGGGLALLRPANPRLVGARAAVMTLCMFLFFAGAPHLTLAQMAAGLYTYPLFVTLLAAPVLGEQVGRWRYGALALGVVGAALILRPWHDGFTWVQVLPVLAGLAYAVNILIIRKHCRYESPLALAFSVGIAFFLSGVTGSLLLEWFPPPQAIRESAAFVAVGWPELTVVVLGFALFASVLNLTGNICMSRAYQTADSSWLAPADFSYLLFAIIWGRILFGDWPPAEGILGMALIAGAGGLTAWRERVLAGNREAGKVQPDRG